MVRTVSDAIVYPHQDSALGLADAASYHATVFSVADLDAETLLDRAHGSGCGSTTRGVSRTCSALVDGER